jgi:hypothetical protein
MELVRKLHALITRTSTETEAAQMKEYTGTIPRAANAPYKMVP